MGVAKLKIKKKYISPSTFFNSSMCEVVEHYLIILSSLSFSSPSFSLISFFSSSAVSSSAAPAFLCRLGGPLLLVLFF